jgi:hypothetical protein
VSVDFPMMQAGHISGEWAINYISSKADGVTIEVDPDYLKLLRDTKVEWVGFCVAINVSDPLDSTVAFSFPGQNANHNGNIFTLSVDNFKYLMDLLQDNGFKTYVNVNFEDTPGDAVSPHRWDFGRSFDGLPTEDKVIGRENWAWDISHPDHDAFVSEFWRSYTERIKFFADLSQNAGVDMFGIGTEIDTFMRNGSSDLIPDDFSGEIANLISQTRSVYHGLLTYDQHYTVLQQPDYYVSEGFWAETGLDVIGISAYFELLESVSGVSTVEQLTTSWERIFENYLVPLQLENPDKPIVFTEFGYTDSIYSPTNHAAQETEIKHFTDSNGNGLDDGEEVQANIYQAFFDVNREHDSLVKGVFSWGIGQRTQSDEDHHKYNWGINYDIREKLAQFVVGDEYQIQESGWTGEVEYHRGSAQPDAFVAGQAAEFFIGGDGLDTLTIGSSFADAEISYSSQGRVTISEGGRLLFARDVQRFIFDDTEIEVGGRFVGNRGDNVLRGTMGDDIFDGRAGNDVMRGFDGNDRYIFRDHYRHDIVRDFSATGEDIDVVDLSGVKSIKSYTDLVRNHMSNDGDDLKISGRRGDDMTLLDCQLDEMSRANFEF